MEENQKHETKKTDNEFHSEQNKIKNKINTNLSTKNKTKTKNTSCSYYTCCDLLFPPNKINPTPPITTLPPIQENMEGKCSIPPIQEMVATKAGSINPREEKTSGGIYCICLHVRKKEQ
jgi:hypothetical protein